MRALGERIRTVRVWYGLSQSALGRKAGLSQSAIAQIENGTRDPSYRTLTRLATAMQVSVSHLVAVNDYRALAPAQRRELTNYAAYLKQKKIKKERDA